MLINLRSLITALALAAALSPAAHAASSSKAFTVTNTGNGPLTISGTSISGNPTDFTLTGNTCTSVAPGGSCAMTVRFTPSGGGPRAAAALNFSSNGTSGPAHSIALSGTGQYPASCKDLLAATPGTPSGSYTIDPDGSGSVAPFSAYCDMTTDGGGWTRVNANVVQTSSMTFGADDVVSGNNAGSTLDCLEANSNWTVTNPVVAHTTVRLEFTRTTTIMQCASLSHSTQTSLPRITASFWSGSAWVDHKTTCKTGDYIWSGAGIYTGTLPKMWRLKSDKSLDGSIRFTTRCGVPYDTGAFTATMWLR